MNKQSFILVALLIIASIVPVFVSANTLNAGITPDSYWYFFDKALDRVEIAFTFSLEGKAKKILEKAEERLAEAKMLADEKSFESLESTLKEYEDGIKNAEEKIDSIKDDEKSVAVLSLLENNSEKHKDVLNEVLNLVPEETKSKIQEIISSMEQRQSQLEIKIQKLQEENDALKGKIENLKGQKEEEREVIKIDVVTPSTKEVISEKGIKLFVEAKGNEVKLNWQVFGLDTTKGFKLVEGYAENPVYPGNSAVYLNGDLRNYTKKVSGGKVLYYRVCLYTGNGCEIYSNNVKIWVPADTTVKEVPVSTGEVKSITLYVSDNRVKWITDGYSEQGFKVVWSQNEGPTYPTREGDKYLYFSDPLTKTTILEPFAGSGKYYVRVCEYLGGKCGVYSNQMEIQL